MSRFGPDPLAFFNSVYTQQPPWDIGQPQPAMAALLAEYPPSGPILDVGCGSGDLALYLAHRGYPVLGVDFVEAAITTAEARRRLLPAEAAGRASFQVADALQPSRLRRQFGSVVDSGFLHLFDPAQGDAFLAELALILPPGGRYYLHAFAIEFPVPNVPRAITTDEVRARFTADTGWTIRAIHTTEFLSRVAPPVPATCACIERTAPGRA